MTATTDSSATAPPPTSPTPDLSASLSALSSRLRIAATDMETSADILITTAASQRHRATLLRREADRVEEMWR
jgi:hypothetical protein